MTNELEHNASQAIQSLDIRVPGYACQGACVYTTEVASDQMIGV